MFSSIEQFIERAVGQVTISEGRQNMLERAADALHAQLSEPGRAPLLLCVCTHNSRRSHFARVWAAMMQRLLFDGEHPFKVESAGTEATACNPRTVASLKRAGFIITTEDTHEQASPGNPVYMCRFDEDEPALPLWSKTIDDEAVTQPLTAIMTCSDADQNCPYIPGARARIRMTFDDPKSSDDTPEEAATYDARSAQIAAEMHYLFSALADK
jgi:arsenate reductase